MADYILLAEFDDYKGRVLRYTHPGMIPDHEPYKSTTSLADRIAEMVIPDSGNDRMIDTV